MRIDINFVGTELDIAFLRGRYDIIIKPHEHGAWAYGQRKNLINFLKGPEYAIEDSLSVLYPELKENLTEDEDYLDRLERDIVGFLEISKDFNEQAEEEFKDKYSVEIQKEILEHFLEQVAAGIE